MTRRVVIVQEYIPRYRVPFFQRLIAAGQEDGIEIVVAAGAPSNQLAARADDGGSDDFAVRIRQREFSVAGRRVTVRRLGTLLKSADGVVMEQARRNLDAYRLFLPRGLRRHRVALWGHGKDFVSEASSGSRALQTLLTNRADWFFAYTQAGAVAVEEHGFPGGRVTVLNNAIDSRALNREVASVTIDEASVFKTAHGLADDFALYIGGLDSDKRVSFLIEAAAQVSARRPSFQLVIAGAGVDAEIVKAAAEKHDWLKYVGPRFGRDKAVLLRSARCLAVPGRVGLVAVDSLAAGVPLATTSWKWHAPEFEYLRSGQNALIVDDTAAAYASAIERLVFDTELATRLRHGAANDWPRYTVDAMSDSFLRGINGMLGS